MRLCGLAECGDDMPKPGVGKPKRRLPTKDAYLSLALTCQGAGTAALAGHNQDNARALAVGAAQEIVDRLMRLRKPPSMQVYSRVYLQTAAREFAMLSPVDGPQGPSSVP